MPEWKSTIKVPFIKTSETQAIMQMTSRCPVSDAASLLTREHRTTTANTYILCLWVFIETTSKVNTINILNSFIISTVFAG